MSRIFFFLFLYLPFLLPMPAYGAPAGETVLAQISQLNKKLDKMTVQLSENKLDKPQINAYWQELEQLQTNLTAEKQNYASSLASWQKKINALGNVSDGDADDEPAAVAKQRKELTAQADNVKAQIVLLDLLSARIDEITSLILKQRNRQLMDNILVKQSSIIHPQEFWNSLTGFVLFNFDLLKSPLHWYKSISDGKKNEVNSNILVAAGSMLLAMFAAAVLRRSIWLKFGYSSQIERPDYSQKVKSGLWIFVARGLIPAAIIGAFLVWLQNSDFINTDNFGLLLKTGAVYLLAYYLCKAVVKVIFVPYNNKWRLIEVTDERAKSVSSSLIISAAAICIVSFFQSLATKMPYDSSMIYALTIFANAVKAFCIILVARKSFYDNISLSDDELSDENKPVAELSTSSKASLWIMFFTTGAFALSLFGYIRLSEYIINRIIISGIAVGIFYIATNLIRGLAHRVLLLRFWVRTFRINRRTLVKAEIWFNLLLTPAVFLFGIFVLLAIWGVPVDLLMARIKKFLQGFDIGGVHISISSIVLGLVSFFVLLSLFKMLKNSFNHGNLSKIEMDDGVKNSIVSSINFLGFIISGIFAIAIMGGSLGSIAIIAGALSFGVGLGLQNMVGNLAAGMTILWERPLRIGDWVVINGQEGIVRQINMRSTELETWDKSSLIIPNSDILSKSFINYTYSGKFGRISLVVSVGYDSDISLVKQTLLEIAASNRDILSTPAPSAVFTNFGDNALDVTLYGYTANVFKRGSILDDLRGKILLRFRELKIVQPSSMPPFYMEYKPSKGSKPSSYPQNK